ncbi:hypothetical protein FS842_006764, partial [Serendipita sp. 407]
YNNDIISLHEDAFLHNKRPYCQPAMFLMDEPDHMGFQTIKRRKNIQKIEFVLLGKVFRLLSILHRAD